MNYTEAITYIETTVKKPKKENLGRITELMHRLGDPQKKLKFVHVAGTNGKGSTCAVIASVLQAAGYSTGLFTSPHLITYNERVKLNGESISDEDLCHYAEIVQQAQQGMDPIPGVCEKMMGIGMLYYVDKKCDVVVLEVGMGGRLDTTNVIDAPEAAVITNIGLEHTKYLGDTVEAIALQKAGIIKPRTEAVVYDSCPGVVQVVRDVCKERNVPLTVADFGAIMPESRSLLGQVFSYKQFAHLQLPLLGNHQMKNTAAAIETLQVLQRKGWKISDADIRKGIATVAWAARFEVLSHDPLVILDGGHNPQCIESLAENIADYLPGQKITFVIGVLADKDYDKEVRYVLPYAKRFICVTPDCTRALGSDSLAAHIAALGCEALAAPSVTEAVRMGIDFGDSPVVAFGSLYISGEVRTALDVI